MPVDYQKGKIYKIVCNVTDEIYIGSTCQSTLARRLSGHVTDNTKKKKGIITYSTSSNSIIDRGNYSIYLIENFPCNNNDELHKREGEIIKQMQNDNIVVNKNVPGRTPAEYIVDNRDKVKEYRKIYNEQNKDKIKEYKKEYHHQNKDKINEQTKLYNEQNKDKIKDYKKEYRHQNKDKISESHKQYYEQNKDKIKEQTKLYREQNKDKINEHIHCDCGMTYSRSHKSRHCKSKKHIKLLEQLNDVA